MSFISYSINLPTKYKSLNGFIYPSLIQKEGIYTIENISEGMVAGALKQASYGIVRTIRDLYGKQKLLLKLVVDFEAVVKRVSSGISGSGNKSNTCKSSSSGNVASTAATTDSGSSATTSPFQDPTVPTTNTSGSTTSMHPSPRKLHSTTTTTSTTSTATASKDNVPAPHLVTDLIQSDQVYHYRYVLTFYTLNTMYIYSICSIYKVYYILYIHYL